MSETPTPAGGAAEPAATPTQKEDQKGQVLALRQSTAIDVSDRGILLRSFEDLQRFSRMILEAGAAPKGVDTLGKVAVAVQMGMERGLAPLGGLRAVFFVNGLPSWRGEAAIALVRQSPLCLYYKAWVEGDGEERRGVCVTHRRGDEDPVRTDFSVRDAKKAGLWNKSGPWQDYPDRQLKWRAIGFNLRDQFPDVLGGHPLSEEAQDYPAEAFTRPAGIPDRPAIAPPPSAPDPLLGSIDAAAAPFPTHAEADRAIAEIEGSPPAATPGPLGELVLGQTVHPADAPDAEKEPAGFTPAVPLEPDPSTPEGNPFMRRAQKERAKVPAQQRLKT